MEQAKGKYLGIEIGGTKIQLCVTDSDYNLLECLNFLVGDSKQNSIILEGLRSRIATLVSKYPIESVGVGFGGPVNQKTGEIYQSFHVQGWDSINLKAWVEDLTNIPTFVDNDANIAALGEATLGAGAKYNRVFYITLGSGVGGGFVIDGDLYHGADPTECEIGHVRLSKTEGDIVESSCSGWALNKKLEAYIANDPSSILNKLTRTNKTDCSKNLMEAIAAGDTGAKKVLDDTIDDLAFGLSHVIHLVNPEIIVIGGGLSNLGTYLTSTLQAFLPNYLMATMKDKLPLIQTTKLKEMAVPYGAVVHASKSIQRTNHTK
ncbi:ROK family protein [Flavobacteriaceae bacterium F89]|uniref:ROK family protein n=1 Tax=Cerina litoralis TaxID=2874477 RepID=A0AAE3JP02_9FLAO|nr:ROK family protein [Cerina litoralis]MCG2461610.1 ROK family protein [Cerina litoralis]